MSQQVNKCTLVFRHSLLQEFSRWQTLRDTTRKAKARICFLVIKWNAHPLLRSAQRLEGLRFATASSPPPSCEHCCRLPRSHWPTSILRDTRCRNDLCLKRAQSSTGQGIAVTFDLMRAIRSNYRCNLDVDRNRCGLLGFAQRHAKLLASAARSAQRSAKGACGFGWRFANAPGFCATLEKY